MPKRKGAAKAAAAMDGELEKRLKARGERMARVRELAGFTSQLQASHKAGVDSGSLSTAERGLKDLYVTTAERLADAYRVPLDVLVGRAPMPAEIDEYPARAPIVRSPEFDHMPRAVTDRFPLDQAGRRRSVVDVEVGARAV